MGTITSNVNGKAGVVRLSRHSRWMLGAIAAGLITSAQAGESFCLAVKAPSKSALLSTASRPPSPQPQAIPVMHTEGTLPHQGIYDISNAAKRDFGYMRDLALAWRMAGDAASLSRLAVYLDDWIKTYRLSFNPIDETGLDGLIDAYQLTRNDLPEATRERTRRFLNDLTTGYLQRMQAHQQDKRGTWNNNWQSHRVKLVTMGAAALDDPRLMAAAQQAFVRQLNANVRADGEVLDFSQRDALHYVVYSLEPLVRAALAARTQGHDWLDLKGRDGQSLRAALAWLKPYADGVKTHEEFARTTVRFDIERRQAGVPGFDGLWPAKTASALYWSASLLDERYLEIARKLNATSPRWLWAAASCR
ncbi:alginate lyase family protein [Dickeya sp. Secpp 1600]|uniref:alginate lyase family protein n=1 Tax=Dickeya sp. Secpp 1600 TaxID=2037915 RepID=UPI00210155CB|nr:alginate lyase family protein [Dickeya sp. Secpp 1600]